MSRRGRGLRRHYRDKAKQRARKILNIRAKRFGENPEECIDDIDVNRLYKNPCKCSCYMCKSPRKYPYSSRKDQLTKAEWIAELDDKELEKIDWLSVLEAEDFYQKVLNGDYIEVSEKDEQD